MYRKITAAITATIMVTALLMSLGAVTGTHTSSASIDESTVKEDTSMVRTITVTNQSGAAIENVKIIFPSGTGPKPTMQIPKDNVVTLENGSENIVTLPEGTLVEMPISASLTITENTTVTIPNGTNYYLEVENAPRDETNGQLAENLSAEVTNENMDVQDDSTGSVGDFSFTPSSDNYAKTPGAVKVTLGNGRVRLASDTQVAKLDGDVVRFPENTSVELVSESSAELGADNTIALENRVSASVTKTVNVNTPSNDNLGRIFRATSGADTSQYDILSGDNVLLDKGSSIVLPIGTEATLSGATTVVLSENTQVARAAGENARMTSTTAGNIENQPKNWMQSTGTSSTPEGPYVKWDGISDNQIASGESLDFPVALTSPADKGDYTIYVKTYDTDGGSSQKTVTLTVDNTPPKIETITASPKWAKENTDVNIEITVSETVTGIDNVLVAENNASENKSLSPTPNGDNTVWTGTYKTGDNADRDGAATITVKGYEDLVGHSGASDDNTFNVDRVAPPTPKLNQISGWPEDSSSNTPSPEKETETAQWSIDNNLYDNFRNVIKTQEDAKAEIRVGDTTSTVTTGSGGYWNYTLTLSEGTQEVGLTFTDRAGNSSAENVENITLDTTAPSLSIDSPATNLILNNTPLFEVSISDPAVGVENDTFNSGDNSGYEVLLRDDDNNVLGALSPKAEPTSSQFNSFTFENQWPAGNALSDGWYNIFVQAGDNFRKDNTYYRFEIDATTPNAANVSDTIIMRNEDGNRVYFGTPTDQSSLTVEGTSDEEGSTITIYRKTDGSYEQVGSVTEESADDDQDWETTISGLSEGVNELYVEETDLAGNTSDKVLLGTVTVDVNAPSISLSSATQELDGTSTASTTVEIEATVTDTVSDYKDISVGLRLPGYTIPQGNVTIGPSGDLSVRVPLREGLNTIDLIAQDGVKNTALKSITVKRKVTDWTMYAMIAAIIAIVLAAIAILRRSV